LVRRLRLQHAVFAALAILVCLGILWRQIDIRQFGAAIKQIKGPFLLLPLTMFLLNLPLRAWRWQLIFPIAARPSFWSCLTVLGIGNMANFLLPGRAGDLARCALAGPDGSLAESSRTLATLAVEKVLDGVALVAVALFSIWTLQPPHWVVDLLRVAVLIFGGTLLFLVALRYRTRTLIDLVRRVFCWLHLSRLEGKFDGLLTAFAEGLSAITSAGRMLSLLLLTMAIWTTEAAMIWALAGTLGLVVKLKSAIAATSILALGFMIPAAPGGLGTYELFGTEAFKLAGVTASVALALTVVIHAWVFVTNVVAGIALLALKGWSLAQLRNRIAEESVADAGSEPVLRPSA